MSAAAFSLRSGLVIDGFVVGEQLHCGGMATLWAAVAGLGPDAMPLVMKVPRTEGGRNPPPPSGFEVGLDDPAALQGLHVPHWCAWRRDFTRTPGLGMAHCRPLAAAALDAVRRCRWPEVIDIGARVATALRTN
ncbi:MAG: serine/threonine protein kinase, partial [Rubrivivax sp.]|nr:serine/threonine protein kinase [Rubrivivax sp.]